MSGLVRLVDARAKFIPGLGGVTAKGFAKERDITGSLQVFNLITWALIAAVNVSATILICLRLWTAHRRANSVFSQSKYKSTIIIVVECGALVTISTIAMLILYAIMHPLGIAGLGITTQVAVSRLQSVVLHVTDRF